MRGLMQFFMRVRPDDRMGEFRFISHMRERCVINVSKYYFKKCRQ